MHRTTDNGGPVRTFFYHISDFLASVFSEVFLVAFSAHILSLCLSSPSQTFYRNIYLGLRYEFGQQIRHLAIMHP